jgi:hypothetical protein
MMKEYKIQTEEENVPFLAGCHDVYELSRIEPFSIPAEYPHTYKWELDIRSPQAQIHLRHPLNAEPDEENNIPTVDDPVDLSDGIILARAFGLEDMRQIRGDVSDWTGKIGIKAHVTKEILLEMMQRVFAAGCYRFQGWHVETKGQTLFVSYLEQQIYYQKALGTILQSKPVPMPCRTYDKATMFFLVLAANDMEGCLVSEEDDRMLQRVLIEDIGELSMQKLILTSIVMRLLGKVEPLKKYLEFSDSNWKRLLGQEDVRYLPMFIERVSGKDSMVEWNSEQFKPSIP